MLSVALSIVMLNVVVASVIRRLVVALVRMRQFSDRAANIETKALKAEIRSRSRAQ
jgi:hypothetical protein